MRSFDIRTMHRHSVSLIIGNHRVVIDIQKNGTHGMVYRYVYTTLIRLYGEEAVRLSTSTRESLGRHHRDIGYSTRESVSDFKSVISDHLSESTEAYSWYMKNTLDFWQHGGLQGYTRHGYRRRRLYAHRQYDRFNRYLRYSVPLLSTCDRIYEEKVLLRWQL
jgi:hypothetical protein